VQALLRTITTMKSSVLSVLLLATVALVQGQQDRINLRTAMCAPLTLAECESVAQNCLDFSIASRESFSDRTNAVSCAGLQGINFLSLWWASGNGKTNKEILADAGANPEQARDIARCVLTNKGFASTNVLDVTQVKGIVETVIDRDITVATQNTAMLKAVNTCTTPTIDTMRDYILCITKVCIHSI